MHRDEIRQQTRFDRAEPVVQMQYRGNNGNGVVIYGSGTNSNIVEGDYIGTNAAGTAALGNAHDGVFITNGAQNNTIGGPTAASRNVISGNSSHGSGVEINGTNTSGNIIESNFVGTDVTGAKALGNGVGIEDDAGANANIIGGVGAGNVISGNQFGGVDLAGSGNQVQGNFIGTDVTGTQAVANNINAGVFIMPGASNNTIGGTAPGAGNLISGNNNAQAGVLVEGNDNLLQGNFIGSDVTGTHPLGNSFSGVEVYSGTGNVIGGTTSGARNLISGNDGIGVYIVASNNQVQGNYIGTDATGTQALSNSGDGVVIQGASNTIGGTTPQARNLISANAAGVVISSTNNVVEGNFIGTDVTGTHSLGKQGDGGIYITGAYNIVGGTTPGAGNLVSGNSQYGIVLQGDSNLVQGNSIGTNAAGTAALGNGLDGLLVTGSNNTLGGTAAGAGNLISGNAGNGVTLDPPGANNLLQGNLIGTDITGAKILGNGADGVEIFNSADNSVGGSAPGAGNVISGNGGSGILITVPSGAIAHATSNLIEGNFIGTDTSATIHLGNAADGVTIRNASNNIIGGTAAGVGNTIAFNGNDGVLVDTGTGNAILSNRIFSSGHLGIELINNGNNNQAAPRLLAAAENGSNTMIVGMLQSTPNTTFTLQFFSDPSPAPSGLGEGQQLLGTFTVTTNADGIASFTITMPTVVPAGQIITATATDPNNNTSEFSFPVVVRGRPDDGPAVQS